MNLKYNDEFRETVRELSIKGYTTPEIAKKVGISRKSVWYILDRINAKYENNIPECPYCNSSRTLLVTDREYKGRIRYYVKCKSCYARGPRIEYHSSEYSDELEAENRAISAWGKKGT